MTAWANLSGARIVSGSLTIPYWGLWVADVVLALSDHHAGEGASVTLTVGDLTLSGTVVRAASFSGSRSARVVGGAGGWRKSIAAQAYRGTVQSSMIIRDAATLVGEKVRFTAPDSQLLGYVRERGPAVRVLSHLTSGRWWMDIDGTTVVGDRDQLDVRSEFTVVSFSGGKGAYQVATEHVADWLPGRSFQAPTIPEVARAAVVTHRFEGDGKARTEVLAA